MYCYLFYNDIRPQIKIICLFKYAHDSVLQITKINNAKVSFNSQNSDHVAV